MLEAKDYFFDVFFNNPKGEELSNDLHEVILFELTYQVRQRFLIMEDLGVMPSNTSPLTCVRIAQEYLTPGFLYEHEDADPETRAQLLRGTEIKKLKAALRRWEKRQNPKAD